MTIEKFLHFVISHNATIIEVLLGLILLLVLFLSVRMFLSAKEPAASAMHLGGGLDLSQLEEMLKQILERAGQVPSSSAAMAATGGSEDSQRLMTEISNLKNELQAKQRQIEEIKSAPASEATAGLSSEEKSKLESQIKDLQAKLSEYEIISEDIADLSFYKEQNVKLQKEIESLKGGGAVATPPPPAAAPIAPAEPEVVGKSKVSEDELAASFAAAASATPEPPVQVEKPTPAPEPAPSVVDDDLMAEFAAAVEKQKATSDEAPKAEAPAAPASSETVDLGQMDMDKMLAEAADIKTDVPDVDPEKALGTSLDENKLLQEAAALEGVSPEDKKLMGDFENFVKKNES